MPFLFAFREELCENPPQPTKAAFRPQRRWPRYPNEPVAPGHMDDTRLRDTCRVGRLRGSVLPSACRSRERSDAATELQLALVLVLSALRPPARPARPSPRHETRPSGARPRG